jgi:hypothetical protein
LWVLREVATNRAQCRCYHNNDPRTWRLHTRLERKALVDTEFSQLASRFQEGIKLHPAFRA